MCVCVCVLCVCVHACMCVVVCEPVRGTRARRACVRACVRCVYSPPLVFSRNKTWDGLHSHMGITHSHFIAAVYEKITFTSASFLSALSLPPPLSLAPSLCVCLCVCVRACVRACVCGTCVLACARERDLGERSVGSFHLLTYAFNFRWPFQIGHSSRNLCYQPRLSQCS